MITWPTTEIEYPLHRIAVSGVGGELQPYYMFGIVFGSV